LLPPKYSNEKNGSQGVLTSVYVVSFFYVLLYCVRRDDVIK